MDVLIVDGARKSECLRAAVKHVSSSSKVLRIYSAGFRQGLGQTRNVVEQGVEDLGCRV